MKLTSYLSKKSLYITITVIIKTMGTVVDLIIPWVLSYIIDDLIVLNDVSIVLLYGALMIACSIVGVAFNIIANIMASRTAKFVTTQLRYDLFEHINQLSITQIDEISIPSLVSRMTGDLYSIHSVIGSMQRLGIRAPILFIGGISLTLAIDWVLALVLIFLSPLLIFIIRNISKKGLPLFTEMQKNNDKMVGVVREDVMGIKVIKAFDTKDDEKKRFYERNKEVVESELKANKTMALSNPLMNFLMNIGLVFVIVLGAYRVNNGSTTPGKIIAFTSYFTIILTSMMNMSRIFVMLSRGTASLKRVKMVFEMNTICEQEKSKHKYKDYHIVFENVAFSYLKNNINNIEQISFKLKKGQSLGIIGPTGAGKTTIINLLMRFYDVSEGNIYINGYSIKNYTKENLMKMFGTVFQNDLLFNRTIKDNVVFYRKYDYKKLDKSLSVSNSRIFVGDQDLNNMLSSKATNISGGQKQRLMIARALYNNPEIIILDDSSSALDYKTDSIFRNLLKENYFGTKIIIAQRVSSIKDCDLILVLDEGRIVDQGSNEYLIKNSQIYNQIKASQMGGE